MKKVILIDDMKSARVVLQILLSEYPELEVIGSFGDPEEALEFLDEQEVDLAFIDIEMPVVNGLDLAKHICDKMSTPPIFAFATAFPSYSLQAWSTDAIGYLTKPYQPQELDKIVSRFLQLSPDVEKVKIKCFPTFQVELGDKSIGFNHEKAKEIFAYLVFHQGAWVRVSELCAEVLEDLDGERAKDSFRSYFSRLKKTLTQYGIADVLEHQYGQYRVHPEKLDCDYYRYLEGETRLFLGEFLKSYPWAEPTLAMMIRQSEQ